MISNLINTELSPNASPKLIYSCKQAALPHLPRSSDSYAINLLFFLALVWLVVNSSASAQPSTNAPSILIEAAGQVTYLSVGSTNWLPATVGLALKPGDRLRTMAASRAALQLSDRSIIRLTETTTLEILPPRHAEKRRFGLPSGSIFFFNREKPSDVEFDTPLAAGAIRGTEFLLEVAQAAPALHLALIDGLVSLDSASGVIALQKGDDLHLQPGQPPVKTTIVNIPTTIQWALYYPAVLNPADLNLTPDQEHALAGVLRQYRSGNLLGALSSWPANFSNSSSGPTTLLAALQLSVGRASEAEGLLSSTAPDSSRPLLELIGTIKGERRGTTILPVSSSDWLARSYTLQARSDLPGALAAARHGVSLAPEFGLTHARLAELEFSFGRRREALVELDRALALSPELPTAHALQGFILLEAGSATHALRAFDRARALDAGLGSAWLGRGLCLMRERAYSEARAAFQAAAALEPERGLYRSYLGKAAGEMRDASAARKELALAKRLDPNDPTAWLYSALELWQENRLNEAIRDLELSEDLNDQRAPFRSQLLLDQDRSVRSADLASLYQDAGFSDVSRHTALRSVAEDYANFSGHLFLANNYQSLEDVNGFNLRLETARESELLVANLLAPPGAGNLSQQLDQQRHLQFFDPRPLAVGSLTEYSSRGDWIEAGSLFGSVNGFSYAFDANYQALNTIPGTNDLERTRYFLTLKQRVTPDDDFYFQFGHLDSEAGDVAAYYDPKQAKPDFHVTEGQDASLLCGWHHQWSPGIHTLLLGARLDDHLSYFDPAPNVLFLHITNGMPADISTPPFFNATLDSGITLYSAELQQIFQTERQSLVFGGRWQFADIQTHAALNRLLTGPVTDQDFNTTLERGDLYSYYTLRILQPWSVTAGLSYNHISFPENTDFPPISPHETSRDQLSPKFGSIFNPWERGVFRLAYTRSLGGLFFDNSVRLEPTQVGGFNQAFRSLIPESVAGLLPAAKFETAGIGFDQSFPSGTWFGVEAEWLTSKGSRTIGILTNSIFLPIPDAPSGITETLNFRERDLSAYMAQLVGNSFSLAARYKLSEATIDPSFPGLPDSTGNLSILETGDRAVLHQVSLSANFNHPSGFFAQWQSDWYRQSNASLAGDDFWQHNLYVGYRFPRRYAEIRFGFLNLVDTDYRLNPLNLYSDLPRSRTFTTSLRLSF